MASPHSAGCCILPSFSGSVFTRHFTGLPLRGALSSMKVVKPGTGPVSPFNESETLKRMIKSFFTEDIENDQRQKTRHLCAL